MARRRLSMAVASAAAAVAMTAVTIAPAAATPAPTGPAAIADAARAAQQAANLAFVERRWDDVVMYADEFDTLWAQLQDARAAAAAELDRKSGEADAAQTAYDEAVVAHADAKSARDSAKSDADDARDAVEAARTARDQAVSDLSDARDVLDGLQDDLVIAQADFLTKRDAFTVARDARDVALAAYNQRLADITPFAQSDTDLFYSVFGEGRPAPTTVSELDTDLQAIAALPPAPGSHLEILLAIVDAIVANDPAVDVAGRRAAYDAAQAAFVTARDKFVAARALRDDLRDVQIPAARDAVEDARAERDAKILALATAKDERDVLVAAFVTAAEALQEAKDVRADALAALNEALECEEMAQDDLDAIDALIDGLWFEKLEVQFRRLDLTDLEQIESEVVWSAGEHAAVNPGDKVSVPFSIPAPTLYNLDHAAVEVITPAGTVTTCDIPADGVVLAGSTVSCTVEYAVTEADLEKGSITLEVKLSGFVPLGPGNRGAAAATSTLIESVHTVTVDVEAVEVVAPAETEEPVEDEATLAATGADYSLLMPAAMLATLGAALIIARRRFEA